MSGGKVINGKANQMRASKLTERPTNVECCDFQKKKNFFPVEKTIQKHIFFGPKKFQTASKYIYQPHID